MKFYEFLFLCADNNGRSILSEVLFNSRAPEGWRAFSAGSKGNSHVHPLTFETLQYLGLSIEGLFSKVIHDYEQCQPNVVITVCDRIAHELSPLYLGGAIKAHWDLADPSHLELPKEEKLAAFIETVAHINKRLDALFSLDVANLHRPKLIHAMNEIAKI